jgi:hypothetical protein
MPKAQRHPCELCGLAIVGKHLARHTGSKACQLTQARRQYTRSLFDELHSVLAELQTMGSRVAELAGELRRVGP